MKSFHTVLVFLLLLIIGCNQKKNEKAKEQADTVTNETILNKESELLTDSAQKNVTNDDRFTVKIEAFVEKYPDYKPANSSLIDTIEKINKHWFIKVIDRNRQVYERNPDDPVNQKKIRKLPSVSDYELIEHIRKADFKTGSGLNDVSIESWKFETETDAIKWYVYLKDSLRTAQFTKPPRFQWVEGNQLILFTIRSAAHWFAFKDSVSLHMTDRTVSQLHTIYHPINLKHFKKWIGPSHGGQYADSILTNNRKSLFDYGGYGYYEYFYFKGQRYTGAERQNKQTEFPSPEEFKIITSLHQPFTGKEQFNEMKETLVAIDCSIEDEDLSLINLVSQPKGQLDSKFGPVIDQSDNYVTYGYANRLFTFEIEDDTIRSYRYRWWQK